MAGLAARGFCRERAQLFRWICTGLLCAAFSAFLLVTCLLDFQRALALSGLTCVVLAFLAHSLGERLLGPQLLRRVRPLGSSRLNLGFKRGLAVAAPLGPVLWLILGDSRRPERPVSFAGVCVLVSTLFACSKHHRAVSWRAVSWGLGLQFVLGLLAIRAEPGFIAFQWLGELVQVFLSYSEAGFSFVLGEALVKDVFAFPALPITVFFSCVTSVLYHVGLMRSVILKIAWLMQVTTSTTAPETLSVAGNIFVSQTEAPLLIRPYLEDMTLSEIHVLVTGGYATLTSSLLGACISLGTDAASLIAAPVLAAPCALALCKLVHPEVEESKFRSEEGVKLSSEAEILTTYALYGFANISSIGIVLGGLISMAPQRKSDFSRIVLRALCTGACVSLVNVGVAGILYVPREAEVDCAALLNVTLSGSSFEVYRCRREAFRSPSPEFSPGALDNCCRFYHHAVCAQ